MKFTVRTLTTLSAIAIASMTMTACSKDDDHDHGDEEELITTVEMKFTPVGGGTTLSYEWRDLDGPGGTAPSVEPIVLAPNTAYNCKIELYNETVTPKEDIGEEVEEEADDHEFYFEFSPVPGLNLTAPKSTFDRDDNGLPLGLTSVWTTTGASTGTARVTLKHKPGIKAANDPISKGETDIQIDFPTSIR